MLLGFWGVLLIQMVYSSSKYYAAIAGVAAYNKAKLTEPKGEATPKALQITEQDKSSSPS